MHRRVRTLIAVSAVAALTLLGLIFFAVGDAEAWKCDKHPEKPGCTGTTTTPPENVTTLVTTTTVPDESTTTVPTTSVPPATTTSVPPTVSENPPSIERSPALPRFAG